ncbi:unnamed protein product [Orchesella dallaii]|uniref:Uncharacterized protein n=1 Tax=Orchesella dallaii TaxID=48710 RepID=A0ABP1PI01_9HEXA
MKLNCVMIQHFNYSNLSPIIQGKYIEKENILNIFRVKHSIACITIVSNRYLLKRSRYDTFVKIDGQFVIEMDFKKIHNDKIVESILKSPAFLTFIFVNLPNTTSADFVLAESSVITTSAKIIVHNQQQGLNFILLNLASCDRFCEDGICYPISVKLQNISANITLTEIQHQWYVHSSNWLKYVSKPYFNRVIPPCDKIRSLTKGKFSNRYNSFRGESCIKLIIDFYHNCTSPDCESFANEYIDFKMIKVRDDTSLWVSSYGSSYIGYTYKFFTPFPGFEGINIWSLLHPISLPWWIVIVLSVAGTSLTLHLLGVKTSFWSVVQITLEQDFNIEPITYKHIFVLTNFIMGGILIRAAYTSTLYSFITEVPLPKIPKSLNETLENPGIEILLSNAGLYLITKPVLKIRVDRNAVERIPLLNKRGSVLWECLLGSVGPGTTYTKLYQNLTNRNPINCILNSSRFKKTMLRTKKKLRRFALLSTLESFHANAITLFGNRMVFQNLEPDTMVQLHGFTSSTKHAFHEYLTVDIGRLEASGIFGMLKEASSNMRKVLDLREERKKLPRQRFINIYTAINCKTCTSLDQVKAEDGNDELSQIESLRVIWFICFLCITISLMVFFFEVLLQAFRILQLWNNEK